MHLYILVIFLLREHSTEGMVFGFNTKNYSSFFESVSFCAQVDIVLKRQWPPLILLGNTQAKSA